jgi:valyl-tRNA synthetase
MKATLPKAYEPQKYEDRIYEKWEKSGFFNPDKLDLPPDAPSYTIVLPPPNITDKLHMGHSAMLAIEDLLIRFHRMNGFRALWIPGTDHAAIATQNVVEKKLFKEQGKTRHELGKEAFLEEVWNFLKVTQATILKQTRKMGSSLDWSREAFTLDEQRKKAVREMFIQMYQEGIIYRGERIVNWCPRCHSTLADDEVEYQEEKTILYTFKYDQNFPIAIATTRPETKLGDTAVAVNPKDKRYQKFIGQTFTADFCGIPLKIKIIADRQVEQDFGTGALGVTPAHSIIDWKMAEEQQLPIIKVIDEDGNIQKGFSSFSGKPAAEARQEIIQCLKEKGLIEKEEEIVHNLSVCYRCGTSIEPLPSKQWFVSVDRKIKRLGNKSLKEKALETAQSQKITFIPERFTKRYSDWMENLHDWCISRQIWFGHEIPVWYKDDPKAKEIYVGTNPPKGKNWVQDPDTLDTWFSSGMWTFSTLGWPDNYQNNQKTGDLAKFHPTQVLETGYEIITLWVSRMIMMSLFALGEIPFSHVYLHGLVLDKHGKKMSKSKGNGIDPLDMIEKYGTDAVRLSLLIGSTPGNDTRMFEEKIEGFRNFINKLWNISRYIEDKTADTTATEPPENLTLADRWILKKLHQLSDEITRDLQTYQFSQAGEKLKDFTWNDFADWYLEISKIETGKEPLLRYILDILLRLWHPFIPFVTEQIYQTIFSKDTNDLLLKAKWPKLSPATDTSRTAAADFEQVQQIIQQLRQLRAAFKIKPATILTASIETPAASIELIRSQQAIINKLVRAEITSIETAQTRPDHSAVLIAGQNTLYLPLEGIIDIEKETTRIKNELVSAQKYLAALEQKLSNQQFIARAPQPIISQEQEKMQLQKIKINELKTHLHTLEA